MAPLPFAASAFCFGSVPKAGRSGYLIYKVSTLRNVRSALAVRFATTVPWSLLLAPCSVLYCPSETANPCCSLGTAGICYYLSLAAQSAFATCLRFPLNSVKSTRMMFTR